MNKCCECEGTNDLCDVQNCKFYLQISNQTSEEVEFTLETIEYISDLCLEPVPTVAINTYRVIPNSNLYVDNLVTQDLWKNSTDINLEKVVIRFLHPDMVTKERTDWISCVNGRIIFSIRYDNGVYYFFD